MSDFILQTCFRLLSPISKNTTPQARSSNLFSFAVSFNFSNAIFFKMCTERLDGNATIVVPPGFHNGLSVNPQLQPPTISFIFLLKWIYTYFPSRSLSVAVTLIRHCENCYLAFILFIWSLQSGRRNCRVPAGFEKKKKNNKDNSNAESAILLWR